VGRYAQVVLRRWSICLRPRLTVADLPTLPRRVATAHRPPSGGRSRRWPLCHRRTPTIRGRSTTVDVKTQTAVDAPSRHAGERSADRPPSGRGLGRSTTVSWPPRQRQRPGFRPIWPRA